jgi:hypothetical protein
VEELYHEATHAYLDLKLGPRGPEGYNPFQYSHEDLFTNPHAQIERKLASPKVQRVMDKAEGYYKGKRLDLPVRKAAPFGLVSDPELVAHEAAAMYVAHRAAWLWWTLDRLEWCYQVLGGELSGKPLKAALSTVKQAVPEYQVAMTERVFGYEERRGKQYRTLAPIPASLRKLCDATILEGKVPDSFFLSPRLSELYWKVIARAATVKAGTAS